MKEETNEIAELIGAENGLNVTADNHSSKPEALSCKMHLSKEEIENMISKGTLEKITDNTYRAKVSTINEMKTQGKALLPATGTDSASSLVNTSDDSLSGSLLPVDLIPIEESPIAHDEVQQTNISSSPGISKIQTRSESAAAGPSSSKRKAQFEDTKIKKPYKYAKTIRKVKKYKTRNYVSDYNSSEDENTESQTISDQLASTFFKKIGETKKYDKSLLDKLHQAIFNERVSDSESDDEDVSDIEQEINDILNEKTSCQMANCPGPGKIETHVGPGKNSKLTIIRSHETKMIKNFLYEVYKVRVASAGREANTNILIPIPEGYKFQYPTRATEESVEFSHLPHSDGISASSIHPKFLEELATAKLKLRKYKDEIKVLRGRYLELLQEYANRPQFSTMSDLVGASAKFLTEDQLVFFLMQLKSGAHNMQGIRYSVREKVFALSMYQKSPEMYKWFRKMFNLPSKRSLDQWLEEVGSHDPGLLKKLMYHIYISYNYKP